MIIMKQFLYVTLIFSMLLFNKTTVKAAIVPIIERHETIEYTEDGSYFVTTLETLNYSGTMNPMASTCSGKKTTTFKSSSDEKLWSVTVTGTFSYVKGSSVKCTASSVSTAVYNSTWKITDKASSKSGNKSTATAEAKHYVLFLPVETITKTVTLTCNTNGVLS